MSLDCQTNVSVGRIERVRLTGSANAPKHSLAKPRKNPRAFGSAHPKSSPPLRSVTMTIETSEEPCFDCFKEDYSMYPGGRVTR